MESRLLLSAVSPVRLALMPGVALVPELPSSAMNTTPLSISLAAHPNAILSAYQPAATAPPGSALTPTQVRSAYGIDQILFGSVQGDGYGQTVAIIDAYHYPTALFDLQQFDAQFGLPDLQAWSSTGNTDPYLRIVDQSGGTNYPPTDPNGPGSSQGTWEEEEALDIQWVHAIAPRANIILVEGNSATTSNLLTGAVGWARIQPGVCAISMSFSQAEFSTESTYDFLFTTPTGHTGITFLAATGDSGQPSGYPAFSPNVVAVGGTTLNVSGNTYVSETGWSGSGGSVSTIETQPSYQNGVVTQSTTRRTNPDVAMNADPSTGVPIYDSYDFPSSPWQQFGGTSLATPMWAGIMAIVNQGRVSYGQAPLDGRTGTLPTLYTLPATDFHDITSGDNGFAAGPGYDLVTGLGSPVGSTLIMDMAVPPLPPSSAPGTPDLLPATDSGVSATDNVTSFDNSATTKALQFSIPNTIAGATVNVYSDGTLIGTTVATDVTATVTTSGTLPLANGTHSITTAQIQPGMGQSAASTALTVTIDTSPVAVVAQSPNGVVAGTQSDLRLTFNEPIDTTSFSLADVTSFTDPSNNDLTGQITGFSWSTGNTTLDIQFHPQSAVGTYQLVLAPLLVDLGGNPMTAAYTATFSIVNAAYVANMDTNPNWTFDLNSAWAWGQPTGAGSHNRDPSSGHTGTNVVGYNLSGDYARNITYYATTPTINCSAYQNLTLSFWRWLGVNSGATASIQASADGGVTWTTLWTNGGAIISDASWTLQQIALPASFSGKSNVLLRWGMGPTGNSRTTYPGWNIDDVLVTGDALPLPTLSGQAFLDANGNGAADLGEAGIPNTSVFLDLNGNGVPDAGVAATFTSTNVPVAIPDNVATGATSTLNLSGVNGFITSLSISFNITHTYDSDLAGYLIGPDGTQVTLFYHVGGSSDNFTGTTLADSAVTSINSAAAPFTGTFRPAPGAMFPFNGKTANGLWQFKVADTMAVDVGTINSWSLNVTTAAEPVTTTDANGNYSFNVSPGTYTVRDIVATGYVPVAVSIHTVNVSTSIAGQNFPLFPTAIVSDTASYYVSLDPTGTILQIAPDALSAASYQIALSLLPSLTFTLTGQNQSLTVDFSNGVPLLGDGTGGITLDATRGFNTSLTFVGQTNAQNFALSDFQFGTKLSPALIAFNDVDNLTLSNMTIYYSGMFSSILNLTLQNNSQLFWS